MPQTSQGLPLLSAAKTFSKALEYAIDDKLAEEGAGEGNETLDLFDADFIIATIRGLTEWDSTQRAPEVSRLPFVLRALFAVHLLPRAHFLRPHLLELERYVSRLTPPRMLEEGARRLELRRLSRIWGLDQHDDRIREFARDPAAMESVLRAEGFEIFVKIQLCYGGLAYDRHREVLQHCVFRTPALADHKMLPGDAFAHHMAESIGRSRTREEKDINNLVDGHALSELAAHVARGKPVRFYTQTTSLRRFRGDPAFRGTDGRSVFRDSVYYLMRCCFSALAFSHLAPIAESQEPGSIRSIHDLRDLSRRFIAFLGQGRLTPMELEQKLESEQTDRPGETLADLINGFYELKFLNSVFLSRWKVDPEMRHLAPGFTSFFRNQNQRAVVRSEVSRSLVTVSEQLSAQVSYLNRWRSDILGFRPSIQARRKEFGGRTPDLWRDMGLGRWGFDEFLPVEVRRKLEAWIASVAEGVPVEHLSSELALQVSPDGYQSANDFALAQCQLWLLKLDARLCEEWRENFKRFSQHGFLQVLQVLHLIAEVRTVAPSFGARQEAQTQHVLALVENAAERMGVLERAEDRRLAGVGSMGVAHVTYWAWKRMKDLGQPPHARAMAERSYDAAALAKKAFLEGSLPWAFALNHAVYIGTMAKVRPAETDRMRKELVNVNPHHYHYRFADTLARRITESVHDQLAEVPGEEIVTLPKHRRQRALLCRRVTEAKKILDDAEPYFGDEEIGRHLQELRDLALTLGCR